MQYSILTSGRLSEDFAAVVMEKHPEIRISIARSKNEVMELLPTANAIAGFNFLGDQDLSHIKWIHAFGAGVDSYLSLKTLSPDTIITRTTGSLGVKMGEFCLAHMLAEIKRIFPVYHNQKKSLWKQLPTSDLKDLTVLILGTGSIGQGVANVLNGHVKHIIGVNRSKAHPQPFDEVCQWDTIPNPEEIDVTISALPNTKETQAGINEAFFNHFNNIIFINIGRGDAVDETGLLNAIKSGQVRKAILDVFPKEPLPEDSPLWSYEKVLISPHQSGITTSDDVISSFESAYNAILKGVRNHLFVNRKKGY